MTTALKYRVPIVLVACVLLAAGALQASNVVAADAAWYDYAWARRQPITIDHSQVVGDLTDFAVLLTEANVQPSLFSHAQPDGSDIIVTADNGVTRLKRELVGYDPVAGTMELYVRVPALSSSVATILYIYYDNAATFLSNDDDTWDSHYLMVQHMGDATPTSIIGSTSNHHVGTKGDIPDPSPTYRVIPSIEVAGKIGKAQEFDRSWIDVGVHPAFNLRERFTVEVWAYPVRPDEQYNGALVSHDMLSTGRQWDAPILMDGAQVTLQVRKGGDRRVHAGAPNYYEWNHIAAIYDYTSPKSLFLNGTKYSQPGDGQLDDAPNTPLVIGTHYKFNWENHPSFLGIIDEVRISDVARSDGWVLTGRNNHSDPGAFCSAGPEELGILSVDIDIKPGSKRNPINVRSKGVIPVAILSTDAYDATAIDPLSIKFGPDGAIEYHGRGHVEDIDNDGDLDLILHFQTQESGIQCGDTSASLIGETFDDRPIEGSDSIDTKGCK